MIPLAGVFLDVTKGKSWLLASRAVSPARRFLDESGALPLK